MFATTEYEEWLDGPRACINCGVLTEEGVAVFGLETVRCMSCTRKVERGADKDLVVCYICGPLLCLHDEPFTIADMEAHWKRKRGW